MLVSIGLGRPVGRADGCRAMRKTKEALLTLFEAVAVGGALLVLPSVLVDLAFGWALTEPLTQLLLFGTASTAILTVIAVYEGWYGDHLARLAGAEPSRLEVTLEPDRRVDEHLSASTMGPNGAERMKRHHPVTTAR
jgi:hypothetical protein